MRRLLVALGALTVVMLSSSPALADPPLKVSNQVTDTVAGLGASGPLVRSALDRLHSKHGIDLYVVLVSGFDASRETDWATATASASALSGSDMLLAIDVSDGGYEWWVDDGFPLPTSDLDDVFSSEVEPLLATGAWADAVVALTDGLQTESTLLGGSTDVPPWSGRTTAVVGAVVLATLGGAHLLSRRGAVTTAG